MLISSYRRVIGVRKKLQIFISSTFTDLQEERQAAVEAVLKAGHIPAGMELFRSGDESQKETITKWIKESDAYMLILGGRYGSIEPSSGKSYTHWEYDFAGELGIPRFAVVISDKALDEKVRTLGRMVLEKDHVAAYENFKFEVLSKTSQFFHDIKDIQLTVMQTLNGLALDNSLKGWISGKEIQNVGELSNTIAALSKEIRILRDENNRLIKINKSANAKLDAIELKYDINKVDLDTRVENLLEILGAERIPKSQISWVMYSDDENHEEEKSITLPPPPDGFVPYFICSEDRQIYEKLLFVLVEDEDINLASRISDIRILIKNCKMAEWVPIEIIVALPGDHEELSKKLNTFLKSTLKKEKAVDPSLFEISLWDNKTLMKLEMEYGFILT